MVGGHRIEPVDLLRVRSVLPFHTLYLLLGLSTIWGICFRSADNLRRSTQVVLIRF